MLLLLALERREPPFQLQFHGFDPSWEVDPNQEITFSPTPPEFRTDDYLEIRLCDDDLAALTLYAFEEFRKMPPDGLTAGNAFFERPLVAAPDTAEGNGGAVSIPEQRTVTNGQADATALQGSLPVVTGEGTDGNASPVLASATPGQGGRDAGAGSTPEKDLWNMVPRITQIMLPDPPAPTSLTLAVVAFFRLNDLLFDFEQHGGNSCRDRPQQLANACQAYNSVLKLGELEVERLRQVGRDPTALVKFIALVKLSGLVSSWNKIDAQLRSLWVEASPLLAGSVEGQTNDTSPAAKSEQSEENGGKGRKPETRKKRSDPKADKRVADAYVAGGYQTEAACASALGMAETDVHRARDRHRKRQAARERARKKPRQ
jgi:hypothetical protein